MPAYYRRGLHWLQTSYLPAPIGGWNPDGNWWELPDNQAAVLDNWLIRPGKLVARGPFVNLAQVNVSGVQIPIGYVYGDAVLGSTSPSGVLNTWWKADNATAYIDPWNAPLLNAPSANLAQSGIAQHQISLDTGLLGFNASPLTRDVSGGPRWINFNGLLYGISYDAVAAAVTDTNATYHMKPLNLLTMPVLQTPDGASYSSQATAGADLAGVGTVAWTTPNNIINFDEVSVATAALTNANPTTHYLQATYGVHTVPVGATIRGVQVIVDRKSTNSFVKDNSVRLLVAGAPSGTDHADTLNNTYPSVAGYMKRSYGGPADNWGLGLTPAIVNAANFGAVLSVTTVVGGVSDTVSVAGIQIIVYYVVDNAPVPTVLSNAPHGAFDLKGYLSRVWLLGGINTPSGLTVHEPVTLFYTNPLGTTGAGTPLGSATNDWKDPVSLSSNNIQMDSNNSDYGVGLAQVPNALVIFRHNSVWLLRGNTSPSFQLKAISHEIGCVDARSIVETDKGVFWVSQRGLMFTDGVSIKNVTGSVTVDMTSAIQQAMQWLQAGAVKSSAYVTAALTSQGSVLITVGKIAANDQFSPAYFNTTWSGLYDPGTGTWSRHTSALWASSLPILLVGRSGRQILMSVGASLGDTRTLFVQLENYASALSSTWGSSFLLQNRSQNGLTDVDRTIQANFSTFTLSSIPLKWVTKAIPFDVSHKQYTLKRYFLDYTFGTLNVHSGGLQIQPYSLPLHTSIDSEQTIPRAGGTDGQFAVGGGPQTYAAVRVSRYSRELQVEVSDMNFLIEDNISFLGDNTTSGPDMGVGSSVLEVLGVGIEYMQTRDYETQGS